MLILGPTGSGKSATVNAMLLHALAAHRPRVFIIDAGGSFDLFGAHCERLGLTVHPVVLELRNDVSLPPFAGAWRLLERPLGPDADLALAETDEAAEEEALEEAPADPLRGGRGMRALGAIIIGITMGLSYAVPLRSIATICRAAAPPTSPPAPGRCARACPACPSRCWCRISANAWDRPGTASGGTARCLQPEPCGSTPGAAWGGLPGLAPAPQAFQG